MLSKFVRLALFLLLFKGAFDFCSAKTDGFSLTSTAAGLSARAEWETAPLEALEQKEVEEALAQKYTYLSSGGQSFSFLSEDGRYVLKLFKSHYGRCPAWVWHMPLPSFLELFRSRLLARREAKLQRDYQSYHLAFEQLRDESGLLLIHLNPTQDAFKPVRLIDKLHIEHEVDLDKRGFLVQRKADLLYERLIALMEKKEIEAARQMIHNVLDTVASRCKKGVFDEDPKIHRNIGFIGAKAIFIDVGRFKRDPLRASPLIYAQDLISMTRRFEQWLEQKYPELSVTLKDELLCAESL